MLFWPHLLTFLLLALTFLLGAHAIKVPHGTSGSSSSSNNNNKARETAKSSSSGSSTSSRITTTQNTAAKQQQTQTATNMQSKRDLSLSYTATDIDSKEGARIKTITVIKNHNKDGKNAKLSINPELYKNEHWADAFRDNFDQFGAIPDVPDIDDLFEFVNKKAKTKPKQHHANERPETKFKTAVTTTTTTTNHNQHHHQQSTPTRPKVQININNKNTESKKTAATAEKPVIEPSIETSSAPTLPVAMTMTMMTQQQNKPDKTERSNPSVEKIKGDAELIPVMGKGAAAGSGKKRDEASAVAVRSQSLSLSGSGLREQLVNVNYSTPQHSVHQYFENYVAAAVPQPTQQQQQAGTTGYVYPRPCLNLPAAPGIVSVSTSSGRTYDVPPANNAGNINNNNNPYIAPSIAKKPPSQQQQQQQPTPPPNAGGNPNQLFPPYANNPNQQQQAPQPSPTYSVNSIVPPLQNTPLPPLNAAAPQPNNVQQTQQTSGYSTSQRPYVAPSLRNGLGFSRGPAPTPTVYSRGGSGVGIGGPTGSPNFRFNSYGVGPGSLNKPYYGRSRGLKY